MYDESCRPNANPDVRKMAQKVHDLLVVPATTARCVLIMNVFSVIWIHHTRCYDRQRPDSSVSKYVGFLLDPFLNRKGTDDMV